MKSTEELTQRAGELAKEIKEDLRYDPHYSSWDFLDERLKSTAAARVTSALDFLRQYAGSGSEWFGRAKTAWERNPGPGGAHVVAEILEVWAADVDRGITAPPGSDASGVRAVASTDLMQQVRVLVEDKSVHPAASIVLAGAALETALRGAVEESGLELHGNPGISAYGNALRAANMISKQEMKDIEQMGGLRNSAAHGDHEALSRERAGLMEQQVNMFLARLAAILGD